MSIIIKSEDRKTGTTSHDAHYELARAIEGTYELLSLNIPSTAYNINEYNNKLVTTADNITFFNITIPVGNYTRSTLETELDKQLNLGGGDPYGTGLVITSTISSLTGKITFSGTQLFGINFLDKKASKTFGFNNSNQLTPLTTSLTGDNIIDLGKPNSIGIQISDAHNHNTENVVSMVSTSLFASLNASFGFYQRLDKGDYTQYVTFKRTRALKVKIVDTSDNTLINLNGGNYTIVLRKVLGKPNVGNHV